MSQIPDTARIVINDEIAKTVARPKLKSIIDSFDGGKTFAEGLALAAQNFQGKAAGFQDDPVKFLKPYATRLVAEGALTWEQTEEEKAAGLTLPTPRAAKPAELDEHGNVVEKPKRQRKSKKKADAEGSTDGEAQAEPTVDDGDELPAELAAE